MCASCGRKWSHNSWRRRVDIASQGGFVLALSIPKVNSNSEGKRKNDLHGALCMANFVSNREGIRAMHLANQERGYAKMDCVDRPMQHCAASSPPPQAALLPRRVGEPAPGVDPILPLCAAGVTEVHATVPTTSFTPSCLPPRSAPSPSSHCRAARLQLSVCAPRPPPRSAPPPPSRCHAAQLQPSMCASRPPPRSAPRPICIAAPLGFSCRCACHGRHAEEVRRRSLLHFTAALAARPPPSHLLFPAGA
jgi:hypothetical protein